MAIDPLRPDDLLGGGPERGDQFRNYHSLRLCDVSYGANNNQTARFRRDRGDGTCPVLPEHDLQQTHLPNQWRRVQILSLVGRFVYLIDGEVVFDVKDPEPYLEGWFGFRSVRNHMEIDRLRVWEASTE